MESVNEENCGIKVYFYVYLYKFKLLKLFSFARLGVRLLLALHKYYI